MTDDAVKNLLDDYALGEKRREAEAARLAAKAAVAARIEELAKAGDVEALAKLAPAKPTELYLALDRTIASPGAAATVDLGPVRVWDLGR